MTTFRMNKTRTLSESVTKKKTKVTDKAETKKRKQLLGRTTAFIKAASPAGLAYRDYIAIKLLRCKV